MDDLDIAFGPVITVKRYNAREIEVRSSAEGERTYHEPSVGVASSLTEMCAKIDKDYANKAYRLREITAPKVRRKV
jgi:hypothetical protein